LDKSNIKRAVSKYTKDGSDEASKILRNRITSLLSDKNSKEAIYKQQDKLAKESIYDVLLSQFMEDAFGIDPDDKVVSVEILDDDTEVRDLLQVFPDDMIERTNLDEILTDNLKNTFLKYGELFLRKIYTKDLVTRLEIMEGQYVYPICDGTGILFYAVVDPLRNDFSIIDPKEILAFQLNPETRKIVVENNTLGTMLKDYPDELKASIPDSYKMGVPLLYNARRELTQLRITNLLTDMAQLRSLAYPTILGVNVENIRDEEQLSELLDTYEEYLEDAIEVPDLEDSEEIDLESLVSTGVKVIPVEGSGKNGLNVVDISSNNNALDDSALDKKKEQVALAAGFPLSAVSVQSNENSKADLSTNRRYRNKCKASQRYIVRPITEWVMEDYEEQNIDVSPEQVRVFCKPIVSLDTAEDLEISLGAITQASQVYEALLVINDNSQKHEIDEDGYYDYFNALLSPFKGAQRLLKERVQEMSEELDDSDISDTPSKSGSPFSNTSLNTPTNNLDRTGIPEIPQGEPAQLDITEETVEEEI
jgi:hypothetical protein